MTSFDQLELWRTPAVPIGQNKHHRPDTLTVNNPRLVYVRTKNYEDTWFRAGDWSNKFLDAAGGRRPTDYRHEWSMRSIMSPFGRRFMFERTTGVYMKQPCTTHLAAFEDPRTADAWMRECNRQEELLLARMRDVR